MRKGEVTVKQMQALDRRAIECLGIPSIALMENAGCAVAREIAARLKKAPRPRVCLVCGLGNNAGDGFVVARHLMIAGIKTTTFLAGKPSQLKNDAAINYKIIKKCKYPLFCLQKADAFFVREIKKADIVVDALFGTGLCREIKDPVKGIIDAVNQHGKYVVSVDIPSGLDGTTGKIWGVCIKAETTITFACTKKGFYQKEGPQQTGRIVVADIGIPTVAQG
jgi:NAD(P)H-hydrate epimerase